MFSAIISDPLCIRWFMYGKAFLYPRQFHDVTTSWLRGVWLAKTGSCGAAISGDTAWCIVEAHTVDIT